MIKSQELDLIRIDNGCILVFVFKKCCCLYFFIIIFFCGWALFSFKFRRCKNMQMQQHNHIIILIQKSMALREPCSSSFINRMANRNVKYACGLLDMLSLILLSCTLLTHRSNSTEISTAMPVHVKEESGFPRVKLSSSLSGKEH